MKKAARKNTAGGRPRFSFLGVCLFTLLSGCLSAQPAFETASPREAEREAASGLSGQEVAAAAQTSPRPVLTAAESVTQGDVLTVFVRGAGIRGLSAEVTDNADKKVLTFTGFRYSPSGGTSPADVWAALGGISSVQAPGAYRLAVRAVYEDGEQIVLSADVEITGRGFVHEEIPLNRAMSSLREDPDPRKAAESRELWGILSSVNLASVYHAGKLLLPVAEGFRETSFFGDRRTFLYTDGGKSRSVHYGLDYATPRGTPVHAAGTGKIVMAKQRLLTGFSVVIEHLPGVYSLYYHLDKIDVKEGQMAGAGQKIGESGFTGLATGPHLHWEVRVAGNAVEPKTLMAFPFIPRPEEPLSGHD
jgi:murein DD-endopeptidase MepM/ murein hydrolase activator NlpD